MQQSKSTVRVFVKTGRCWGRVIGEDSGVGACQLCVETCPEVFEKPLSNRCASVRPDVDPTPYLARVHRAMKSCPVNAISLVKDSQAVRNPNQTGL